jgi:hypothetical protein
MDNRDDVAFLESAEGSQSIVNLHVEGIRHFWKKCARVTP